MSSDKVIIAELRDEKGSNAARRLRAAGKLPAIYNDTEGNSVPITIDAHEFNIILQHHRGDNLLLAIKIGDKPVGKALLKEVQHNSVTNDVVHADFLEVSLTEKINVSVEVELVGESESEGVKAGGVIEHLLREVEVECLPTDIVETVKLDVSNLKLGETLTVGDIETGDAITILTDKELPVVTIAVPKTAEQEEAEAESAAEGAAEEAAPASEEAATEE